MGEIDLTKANDEEWSALHNSVKRAQETKSVVVPPSDLLEIITEANRRAKIDQTKRAEIRDERDR